MEESDVQRAIAAQLAAERRVARYLDDILQPRGFGLAAQQGFGLLPDGSVAHEVIYEADPEDYARRYPALRRRFEGDVPCIDLRINLGDGNQVVSASLEVDDIWDLLLEIDAPLPRFGQGRLDAQLTDLADSLRRILDDFAGKL